MSEDKMKIKDIEGSSGAIKDFFKDVDFDWNAYLNDKPPLKKLIPRWILIVLTVLYFICCCTVW